jgi:hypothetical protein
LLQRQAHAQPVEGRIFQAKGSQTMLRILVLVILASIFQSTDAIGQLQQNCTRTPQQFPPFNTIQVITPTAASDQPVTLEISGANNSSPTLIYSVSSSTVGSVVTVNAQIQVGLIGIGSSYCYRIDVGPLAAGQYQVNYTRQDSVGEGQWTAPTQVAAATLNVADADPASIPVLSPLLLGVLAIGILSLAAFRLRAGRRVGRGSFSSGLDS